jgi:hypothetical protein
MAKPKPSRVAAALQYLQQMRDRASEFGGGVVDTLNDRAQDVGGLAYEAFTSDPNIGRMTTAEFSQAAADRPPTPRLDAMAQGIGAMGKALITQPLQTAKAVVVDPVVEAFESPRAMGQFAGEFVNPMRIAAALRKTAPIAELDVYHGTPHKYAPTEANPLGEFDASKIGTGEGAQAYGHGIYFAENMDVAKGYQPRDTKTEEKLMRLYKQAEARQDYDSLNVLESAMLHKTAGELQEMYPQHGELVKQIGKITAESKSSLYKADLPDQMIDRMLDWDKPLSEQPENVQMALAKLGEPQEKIDAYDDALLKALFEDAPDPGSVPRNPSGADIVSKLEKQFGRKGASDYLRGLGIPGIRYLDAGSRGGDSATGTRNFVVFPGEEKKVKILKRD